MGIGSGLVWSEMLEAFILAVQWVVGSAPLVNSAWSLIPEPSPKAVTFRCGLLVTNPPGAPRYHVAARIESVKDCAHSVPATCSSWVVCIIREVAGRVS